MISFMPYCYVEDTSIVAMSRAKAVRAHAVRCSGRNSAVYLGHFFRGWVHVATIYLSLFFLCVCVLAAFYGVFRSV